MRASQDPRAHGGLRHMARQGQGATERGYRLWEDHANLCERRYAPMSSDALPNSTAGLGDATQAPWATVRQRGTSDWALKTPCCMDWPTNVHISPGDSLSLAMHGKRCRQHMGARATLRTRSVSTCREGPVNSSFLEGLSSLSERRCAKDVM